MRKPPPKNIPYESSVECYINLLPWVVQGTCLRVGMTVGAKSTQGLYSDGLRTAVFQDEVAHVCLIRCAYLILKILVLVTSQRYLEQDFKALTVVCLSAGFVQSLIPIIVNKYT